MSSRRLVILGFIFFLWALSVRAQELYRMPEGVRSHVSSLENLNGEKGAGGRSNKGAKGSAFTDLKAGDSLALLNVRGAGIIQRIWITISDRSPEMLRDLRIRMYWDGASVAAVDVPFGDFFCAPLGKPAPFESALFSNPEGRSFNSYIPMPFRTAARVVLANEGKTHLSLVFFDVDFLRQARPAPDQLYFHASWNHRDSLPIGEDLEMLPRVRGRGRFLGVSVGVRVNPVYGNTWWGEGEVKMYLDGDSTLPTINGTGAEDYIGTGWGEGVFAHSYQGCLTADGEHHQYSFYRFHIPDAIWFYQDCRVTIQEMGGGNTSVVRELLAKGVSLRPVSVDGAGYFRRLLEPAEGAAGEVGRNGGVAKAPADMLAKAAPNDWTNFYRSDDYAVTAYYYLDRP
jgi:hypothetical protein